MDWGWGRVREDPPDMTISPTATPEPTEVFPNKGTLSVLDESAQEVMCPGVVGEETQDLLCYCFVLWYGRWNSGLSLSTPGRYSLGIFLVWFLFLFGRVTLCSTGYPEAFCVATYTFQGLRS